MSFLGPSPEKPVGKGVDGQGDESKADRIIKAVKIILQRGMTTQ